MLQILSALDFLHTLPNVIVHRDVKPQNVLLKFDRAATGAIPVAKLADFGIARALSGPGSTRLTQVGGVPGTLFYLAPELLLSGAAYVPNADVYSVGVTIYHVLTGRYPYEFPPESSDIVSLLNVYSKDPIPIRERLHGISQSLATVIDTACARDPDRRHPNAGAFAEALRLAANPDR